MAEYADREHYLPVRKSDLVELLCNDTSLSSADRDAFRQFCKLIAAVFHFEYHQRLESLKDTYAPFDPDCVTKPLTTLSAEERPHKLDELFRQFEALMERANFKKVDDAVLAEANSQASQVGLQMYVDFGLFEKLAAYSRGEAVGTRILRHWLWFWRKRKVDVPLFQRLAVIAKMRKDRRLGSDVDTNCVYLKIFKDVPRMDVEMLLPGARLRMPGFQRLKMGGSWIGGLAYLVYSLSTEVFEAVTRGLWYVIYGPLLAFLGYGYKQWYGYQSTKTAYGLRLSQSLYYQTLDSNAGVIHHLLDEAEEQDCREALLAYYYLRHADESGWTSAELDDYVEASLEKLTGLKFDFEIGDAIAKLERHKLIERVGDRYRAMPLAKALVLLDYAWDNYFNYSNCLPSSNTLEPGRLRLTNDQ
ncbi:MAG TPA: DUF3754 domain-containing protein [Gemmataceae bacterium]|nr:DUF3754 domain-containing protein [Gemmataceae bacterium]